MLRGEVVTLCDKPTDFGGGSLGTAGLSLPQFVSLLAQLVHLPRRGLLSFRALKCPLLFCFQFVAQRIKLLARLGPGLGERVRHIHQVVTELILQRLLLPRCGLQLRHLRPRVCKRRQRLREHLGLALLARSGVAITAGRKVRPLGSAMSVPPQAALLTAESAISSHAVRKAKVAGRAKMNFAHGDPQLIATNEAGCPSKIA